MDPRLTARYALSSPRATHFRRATCDEVACKHKREGWQIKVYPGPLGGRLAHLIKESGRKYKCITFADHALYTFEAGQQCFKEHTVKNDKPALYLVRQGTEVKHHVRPTDWVEDFSEHLDKIREQ